MAPAGQSVAHRLQPVQVAGFHFKKLRRRAGTACRSNGYFSVAEWRTRALDTSENITPNLIFYLYRITRIMTSHWISTNSVP